MAAPRLLKQLLKQQRLRQRRWHQQRQARRLLRCLAAQCPLAPATGTRLRRQAPQAGRLACKRSGQPGQRPESAVRRKRVPLAGRLA